MSTSCWNKVWIVTCYLSVIINSTTSIILIEIEDRSFRGVDSMIETGIYDSLWRASHDRVSPRTVEQSEVYLNTVTQLKQQLHEIRYVCTTANAWSNRRRRFLGVIELHSSGSQQLWHVWNSKAYIVLIRLLIFFVKFT